MFSVIIPLYNKELYIVRCLNSVYSQSCQDFEIIVINDGSTDHGAQKVKEKFPQVTLIEQQNQGVSTARNVGIEKAKNQYIAFLDADDEWHPHYLTYIKEVIDLNDDVKIVGVHYSVDASIIKKDHTRPMYYEIKNYFKVAGRNTLFSSSSTVVNRDAILKNDIRFNLSLKGGEDSDFWYRVNLTAGKAFYILNTLVFYSNEDLMQATRSLPHLGQTLIGTIGSSYRKYYEQNADLRKFIGQYILLNLFPYYYSGDYHALATNVIRNIPGDNLFLTLAYRLPLSLGTKIINNEYGRKFFRLYLKFIIRIT